MESELDEVAGVKTDSEVFLGGVGVAGITFGVPGCFNGVTVFLPFELGFGLPFKPSYFPLAPGEFP